MGIGLEIMPLSDKVHDVYGQMYENYLWPWHLTLKVKLKVIQILVMWKVIGNNIGMGLDIMPLSDLVTKLQGQMG